MRTFQLEIREELTKGLRPDSRIRGKAMMLSDGSNFVPHEVGVVRPDELTAVSGYSGTWPLPAIFEGSRNQFIVEADALYVDGVEQTVYDLSAGTTTTFTFVDKPHFVDMGDAWFFTDGTTMLLKPNYDPTYFDVDYYGKVFKTTASNVPMTGTYHKGRVLTGGMVGSYFPWTVTKDCVVWSSIGGGDVFWPFISVVDSSSDLYKEHFDRNEWGWAHVPFAGEVLAVKTLGNDVAVYGTEGVGLLRQQAQPMPTFGVHSYGSVGLLGRNAVAGDSGSHVFLDKNSNLWSFRLIEGFPQLQKMGYQEYMENLGNDPVFSFCSGYGYFYLCGADGAYVYSRNGLGVSNEQPSGVGLSNGTPAGILFGTQSSSVSVTVGPFDMGFGADKRLDHVYVDYSGLTNVTVMALSRIGDNVWSQMDAKSVNPVGVAYIGLAGKEFKLVVSGTDSGDGRVSGIAVQYQVPDKRAIRSNY